MILLKCYFKVLHKKNIILVNFLENITQYRYCTLPRKWKITKISIHYKMIVFEN